jgi:anaerobic magnesium-protoporphyrin IX monomethyl ester cyclase
MNVATTRGCPFHCNWCAKPIYGNRYTSRSPASVADEIEQLLRLYQPDHLWFCDDIFGLKPGWVQQFRLEVKRRNLAFRFKIQSRADLLLQSDSLAALAESGAETVWIGAESGSQKVLDAMDKGITVDQISRATQLLKKHGIRVGFFLQFGYPGEGKKDIDDTIRMVMDLMPDEVGVSVSYPLPGTPFHDRVRSELKSKQNWKDSDDLAMMFRNTYSPAFYRLLHRYLHGRFRMKRGMMRLKSWMRAPHVPSQPWFRSVLSMLVYSPITMVRHVQLKLLN